MTAESWTTSGGAGSSFFEGWYYKIESADGRTVVVIPGIIFGEVESFAFVMFSAPAVTGSNRRIALYRQEIIRTRIMATVGQTPQFGGVPL